MRLSPGTSTGRSRSTPSSASPRGSRPSSVSSRLTPCTTWRWEICFQLTWTTSGLLIECFPKQGGHASAMLSRTAHVARKCSFFWDASTCKPAYTSHAASWTKDPSINIRVLHLMGWLCSCVDCNRPDMSVRLMHLFKSLASSIGPRCGSVTGMELNRSDAAKGGQ